MKRIIIPVVIFLLMITGCSQPTVEELIKQEKYEEAYKTCKTSEEKAEVLDKMVGSEKIIEAANLV